MFAKFSFWEGNWALGYNSMKFCDFSDFSKFPKIVSLKLLNNLLGNLYILWLLLITLCFTYDERAVW